VAPQAHRGAFLTTTPSGRATDNGTSVAAVVQGSLALSPAPSTTQVAGRRRRRSTVGLRLPRRRTGPCTVSYRLVAARCGARVLRSPAWLRTVRASPAVAALRADSRRTVLEVATGLALAARADSTAAPTWPVLVEASGYSRATVARVLAWLREQKLLVTLENGSTPQFRPRPRARRDRPAPVEVEGNRSAVYLLTEPLPEVSPELVEKANQSEHYAPGQEPASMSKQVSAILHRLETPPHLSRRESVKNNPAGASARRATTAEPRWKTSTPTDTASGGAAGGTTPTPGGGSQVAGSSSSATHPDAVWGESSGGQPTRGQRRAALVMVAEQLRTRALDLRPLSVAAVASVIRNQVTQGWGVEDFVWAIDHTPDGKARTYTAGLSASASASASAVVVDVEQVTEVIAERRHRSVVADGGARAARAVAYPAAWLRWRLAPWQGLAGPVAVSRAAAAQRSVAAAAATAARRAEQAAAVAQAVPPPVVLAEARAALRARRTW